MKLSLIFTLVTLISVSTLAATGAEAQTPAQVPTLKASEIYLSVSKELNKKYENYTIRRRSRYTQLNVISTHGESRLALYNKNEKWYC